MRKLAAMIAIALLVSLFACGGTSSNGSGNPPPATQVKLNMTTASSLVGQTAQFSANVPVTWAVKEANGGSITSGGLYTAPHAVGAFHVVATAVSDTTKSATASVSVSAKFAHIQELPNGATPYSVTPIIDTVAPDGTFTSQNIIDTGTTKPVDTQMEDVFLSPDGTKGVFTMYTYDPNTDDDYQDIWIANADGSGQPVQLTSNETALTWGADRYPSFTPDGKAVIFTHQDSNGSSYANTSYSLQKISVDGTNRRVLFAGDPSQNLSTITNPFLWHAAMSPDGKSIAVEWASMDSTQTYWSDGIATMTSTGTDVTQLTGNMQNCYDEMPAYSVDGSVIVFSRLCGSETSLTETIMSMSPAGQNVAQLQGVSGLISCQPRAMADKIAFSSNMDNPATDWFDMYLMNTDGSNLKRFTNNSLYDGFSIWWWSGNSPSSASARVVKQMKGMSPIQEKLDHIQQLRDHRKH